MTQFYRVVAEGRGRVEYEGPSGLTRETSIETGETVITEGEPTIVSDGPIAVRVEAIEESAVEESAVEEEESDE